jgi:hypothetical protein
MSERQKKVFRISLILPFLLLICVIFCVQKNSQGTVNLKSDEALLKKYKNSFGEYLETNVFATLKNAFKTGRFDDKRALIAERTVIFSPQGERYTGRVELEQYFAELKKMEVTDLLFTINHVEVFLVEDPIEKGDHTINAIGFGIWSYQIIKEKSGEIISVDDPSGSTDSRHHSACVWEPDEPGNNQTIPNHSR